MKPMMMLMLLMLVSCEKSGTNESMLFQSAPPIGDGVDFATLSSFILTPKCLRCHAWAGDEGQVQSRIVAGNPDASQLYIRVVNGSMPMGGPALTTAELEVVAAYINGPTGDTTPPTPPVPVQATYTSLKVNLFERSCTACHNAGGQKPNLTRLDKIRDEIEDIQEQLDFGTMPPTGAGPNQEVLDAFREWVINGMPNN